MFQIRVKEVYALNQLDGMSKTKEFAEAAGKAMARPVTSAANMIINPVETVEGLSGGVTRLFDRIKLGGEAIAASATAPSQTDAEKASAVTQRVGILEAAGMECLVDGHDAPARGHPQPRRGRGHQSGGSSVSSGSHTSGPYTRVDFSPA